MPDELLEALREQGLAGARGGVALAAHTTLRVGGPAAAFVRAERPEDLAVVGAVCASLARPWLVLGRGSNLLVADAGWPGIVVTLGRGFRGVEISHGPVGLSEDQEVVAGAAEPMPVLASTVARAGLGGFAFGTAIPGTLGGAVRMNAGAHGRDMAAVLRWVEVVRPGERTSDAEAQRLTVDDLQPAYRHTALPADAVVVRACLRLRRGDAAAVAAEMDEMRRWRREHQPVNEPSCGSVFRNPPGDSAGRLLEASGLKGLRIGGAQISERHANFITAGAGATAADVLALIRHARSVVAERHGVTLRTEVILAGFDGEGDAELGTGAQTLADGVRVDDRTAAEGR